MGALPPEVFEQVGYHQVVSNGDLLFLGGTTAARGSDLEIVGKGDLEVQCSFILDVLDRSLQAGGSSREHILNWTIFIVDTTGEMGSKYMQIAPILREWLGSHQPAATAVGVSSLFTPDLLLEIEVIAAVNK